MEVLCLAGLRCDAADALWQRREVDYTAGAYVEELTRPAETPDCATEAEVPLAAPRVRRGSGGGKK